MMCFEWLVLLRCMRDVISADLGFESGYPDWRETYCVWTMWQTHKIFSRKMLQVTIWETKMLFEGWYY